MTSSKEFMMPLPPEGAAMQFFIEAMKANTAVLERVGKNMEGVQAEQKETLKLIHDTRDRVIRIESNRIDRRVEAIEGRVDKLEDSNLRREGATGVFNWVAKHGTSVAVMIAGIVLIAFLILKATGRLP